MAENKQLRQKVYDQQDDLEREIKKQSENTSNFSDFEKKV
jgi:hypothetical protein